MTSDFIKRIGGYDSSAIRAEDYEMWIRVLSNKGVIETIPEILYNVHLDWHDYKKNISDLDLLRLEYSSKD